MVKAIQPSETQLTISGINLLSIHRANTGTFCLDFCWHWSSQQHDALANNLLKNPAVSSDKTMGNSWGSNLKIPQRRWTHPSLAKSKKDLKKWGDHVAIL